jgi:tetratricopeptide (TPR) repeat protein
MARLGRLREALEDLDEAVRLDPDSSIMFSDRAFVRRESGDLDGSLSDCEQAMRLDPEFQRPYLHRARAHEARGNVAAAIADYDEYLKRGGGRLFEDQSEIEGRLQDLRESQK